MSNFTQITSSSIVQAFSELRANRLRTSLSLLGITIGIFCIIGVLTVLDSMKNQMQKSMSTLGGNILYIDRFPWSMEEMGTTKFSDYMRRPGITPLQSKAVETQVTDITNATLCLDTHFPVKHEHLDVSSVTGHAVSRGYDRVQNIDIGSGRYLAASELDGGNNSVVLGYGVYESLFPANISAIEKKVTFLGRRFLVVGVMKKKGQNMAGLDIDNSVI